MQSGSPPPSTPAAPFPAALPGPFPAAFPGEVPANLRCGFCGQPIENQFYRTINRFACDSCAAQVHSAVGSKKIPPHLFLVAGLAGLATALAGAAVWATVVHVMHWNIGILAFFIGVAIGKVVHFVSGKGRAVSLQWMCVILAAIGVLVGKVAIDCWDALDRAGAPVTLENIKILLQAYKPSMFQPFDFVWIGIAGYAAWRLCKPANVSVAGPFAYRPSASALQFNTVEPLQDIPPATPPGKP